jgi:predicted dehydrogenase
MRVAVIGLGSAGARHARNLLDLGHEVVGFDPVASSPHEDVELNDTLEAAIGRGDAVIVASPNSLHAEHALAALELRKPVLVEKPLAVTVVDAERVTAAAERTGAVCGVGMNLRFHPGVLKLKRLVDEGALGDVRFVQGSFGYDLRRWHPESDYRLGYSARADLGGGIVLDAIHELDYLLWIFGTVETVIAEVERVSDLEVDVEDIAVAVLRFDSGAVASVDLNFFEPAYRRGCTAVGSHAVARWDWRQETVVVSRPSADDEIYDVTCDLAQTYRAELVDFVHAVESAEQEQPAASANSGLAAVRLADAIKRSARVGQRIRRDAQ